MRTTIELPDGLFRRAKRIARERGTTLNELVGEGLRVVTKRSGKPARFHLRDASFGEGGLVEGVSDAEWEGIRSLAYGRHCG